MTDKKNQPQAGDKRVKVDTKSKSDDGEPKAKRGRGRPKGSKNKAKVVKAHVTRDQRLSARNAALEKNASEGEKTK